MKAEAGEIASFDVAQPNRPASDAIIEFINWHSTNLPHSNLLKFWTHKIALTRQTLAKQLDPKFLFWTLTQKRCFLP